MHQCRRVVASGLAVLMMVQTTGCHSWNAVVQPLPEAIDSLPGRRLQLVLQDDGVITADSARTNANVLIAYQRESIDTIALADVKEVRSRQSNPLKTAGLVLGLVLGIVVPFMVWATAVSNANKECC